MRGYRSPRNGKFTQLGASWDGAGVHFALFSERAKAVELQLFDQALGPSAARRVALDRGDGGLWSVYVDEIGPGQLYGYRVDGPWDPAAGDRFDPSKLLLDPYARAIAGSLRWHPLQLDRESVALLGSEARVEVGDSAVAVPPCVVVDPAFPWDDDRPPATPWQDTLLYECHVKGLTARHPDVPEELRGTYLGLASAPVIEHLTRLGVTAVELLPVHQSFTERRLVEHELTNYWGYNTIGFFAPEARYATAADGRQVWEFKAMVQALHKAGIEVILDVVFNHTGEGDRMGPTLSFRGIDNRSYYQLDAIDRRRYLDYSGCGNSLDLTHPQVLRLVADSLRYWASEMHVDGFRFDLAPALGRRDNVVDLRGGLFAVIHQDPILSQLKLIAEPWDLGIGGHRLGGFPAAWSEWNDRYRDTTRRFWRGDRGQVAEFASRLAGSRDLFSSELHLPRSSVNFVTCHDGFTLADLVRYSRKHNEANREGNRDGCDDCHIGNWGVEGEAIDPAVRQVRARVMRSLTATLAFSLGTPMLSHGDEVMRTQNGNNNAYCQDNEISWIDWKLDPEAREHLEFTRRVLALRRAHPGLRRRWFLSGKDATGGAAGDVIWMRADGGEMAGADWDDPERRALAVMLRDENDAAAVSERGGAEPLLLLLINGASEPCVFHLPEAPAIEGGWCEILNSAPNLCRRTIRGMELPPHTLVLFTGQTPAEPRSVS